MGVSASRIEVSVEPTERLDVMKAVRAVVGGSIADMRTLLSAGAPLLAGELGGDDGFDDKLRQLVASLTFLGMRPRLVLGSRVITLETLRNLFERNAEEMARQERLLHEEAEAEVDRGQDE